MKTIALPSMLGLFLALSTPAQAIPETWVASNGSGSSCTRAAPCGSFQIAHDVTDPEGIIKCVDAGNFGPVTILKSITIDCTGTNGGIATGPNGIIVNNASFGGVTLRGLSIDQPPGGSQEGVRFVRSDGGLHIEDCRITRFGRGIAIEPSGSNSARVVLNRVTVERNFTGISALSFTPGPIVVQVGDSVVARNGSTGIAAFSSNRSEIAAFVVDRSSIVLNGGDGIHAAGAGAVVHLGNSTVIGNAGGLITVSGGQILSYQNNQASGNGVDGAPTSVLTV